MLIYAIDDEAAMLEALREAIAAAAPEAELRGFRRAGEALRALDAGGPPPDVVFSDIELPGMDGLQLAVQIKNRAPQAKIVFVTGYSQYALEAWRRRVNGYLMKPVDAAMIRAELDALALPGPETAAPEKKLRVRCFGSFDVFWNDEPLLFKRSQTKELLAYLIDREGAACTGGEIALALWENEIDTLAAANRLRVLINDLRTTLRGIGMEDALLRERRQLAIRRSMVDCDYYRMRDGDPDAINAYQGEYMRQYSWAELTAAKLHFRRQPPAP